MAKQNDDFEDRIFKFYQYLEKRLEIENERKQQIPIEEVSKPDEIIYKREKKQPIASSI